MLVNRWLKDKGYIFVRNANPIYIKMLIDLGSYPIFTYTHNNYNSIYIGWKWDNTIYQLRGHDLFYKQDYSLFNFDVCTISDIKYFLSKLLVYGRYNESERSMSTAVSISYEFSIMYFK